MIITQTKSITQNLISQFAQNTSSIQELFQNIPTHFSSSQNGSRRTRSNSKLNLFNNPIFQKLPKKTLAIVAILIGIITISISLYKPKPSSSKEVLGEISDQLKVSAPIKKVNINQSFSFPLTDKSGNTISQLNYTIESAELRDEIIVSGKKAYAIEGRDFFILNLKVSNDYNKSININSRDYVRLIKNGNQEEKLAPEIHNDPVEVQAISTKNTRIGFTINETDTDLILQVGEINSDKQDLSIKFD